MEKQQDKKSKIREIHPRKLAPPPEVAKRIMENDKKRLPHNPVIKFLYLFFGEGL